MFMLGRPRHAGQGLRSGCCWHGEAHRREDHRSRGEPCSLHDAAEGGRPSSTRRPAAPEAPHA